MAELETIRLPSSQALIDSVAGFSAEALAYRDERFEKRVRAAGMFGQCEPMLAILKDQTSRARAQEGQSEDSWSTDATVMLPVDERTVDEYAQQSMEAEVVTDSLILRLAQLGVTSVRLDYALGPNAQMFVGVKAFDANDEVVDTSSLDEEIGTPVCSVILNECMFSQARLMCQDGVFYQADTREQLLTGADGLPVRATREQVDEGLLVMQEAYNALGVSCEINEHDFAATQRAIELATRQQQAVAPTQLDDDAVPEAPDEGMSPGSR